MHKTDDHYLIHFPGRATSHAKGGRFNFLCNAALDGPSKMPTSVRTFAAIIILTLQNVQAISNDTLGDIDCYWTQCSIDQCSSGFRPKYITLAMSTCEEDGSVCKEEQHSNYCCVDPYRYSSVYWLGYAPNCSATCNDCGEDECVVENHPCGDSDKCITGGKVLCGVIAIYTCTFEVWKYALIGLALFLIVTGCLLCCIAMCIKITRDRRKRHCTYIVSEIIVSDSIHDDDKLFPVNVEEDDADNRYGDLYGDLYLL